MADKNIISKAVKSTKDVDLVEKVKAVNITGDVYKNAMDNNSKNTKELYEVLKKEIESNTKISSNSKETIEKVLEAYEKGLDKATSEEERKQIYEKLEKLLEEYISNNSEEIENNKQIVNEAVKNEEQNKKFNWNTVVYFGFCTLSAIGLAMNLKNRADIKNLLDRK